MIIAAIQFARQVTVLFGVFRQVGVQEVNRYDMTAGASGGPWWIGIRNPDCSIEYADVDGSDATDWFQGNCSTPFIFGVNSHRRLGYTSEMGSPPFLDIPNTGADSESIFADCFNNGGA